MSPLKKHLFIVLSLFLLTTVSFAQPSDATVKAKVKEKCVKNNSKLTSLTVSKGSTEKEIQDGAVVYYHYRNYTLTFKTDYPGVTYLSEGTIMFKKTGGNFVYVNHNRTQSQYKGIPKPSLVDINQALNEIDPEDLVDEFDNSLVSIDSKVNIAPETEWIWTGLNEVKVNIQYTGTRYKATYKLGTYLMTKTVTLRRSKDGNTFDKAAPLLKDGKWLNTKENPIYFDVTHNEGKLISEREISADEKKNILPLREKRYAENQKTRWTSLPKVNIPEFKHENEARQFVHHILFEGDTGKVAFVVFKMMPDSYKNGSEFVLNQHGENLISKVKHNVHNYSKIFCEYPEYRQKKSGGYYSGPRLYFDRLGKKTCLIAIDKQDDKWIIKDLRVNIPSNVDPAYLSAPDSVCGKPIFFSSEDEVQFPVGTRVTAMNERGQWRNGEVIEVSMENRQYRVRFGNDRNAYKNWVDDGNLRLNTEAPTKTPSTQTKPKTTKEPSKTEKEAPKTKKVIKKPKIKLKGLGIGG